MDIYGYLVFGVIAFLAGVLSAGAILFYVRKEAIFEEIASNIIDNIANSEEMQRNLFQIGGIIAQGAKTGFGITAPAKGGKFTWQNMLMEIVGEYAKTKILASPSPSPGPSPLPQAIDKLTQNRTDKW